MPYKLDDATLERINRRMAERWRSCNGGARRRTTAIAVNDRDDAESAALQADIAEIVARFSTEDLRNALVAATKKVWGDGVRCHPGSTPGSTCTESIAARQK